MENPDLHAVLRQLMTQRSRLVYRVAIHDQKHLPPAPPHQAQSTAEEIQKHPRRETLTQNHEGQPPRLVTAEIMLQRKR
jgi:hypothetical protein